MACSEPVANCWDEVIAEVMATPGTAVASAVASVLLKPKSRLRASWSRETVSCR
ncbi:MAG: hypothetical protein WDN45_03675 [Caulobacteraceae bacterium]